MKFSLTFVFVYEEDIPVPHAFYNTLTAQNASRLPHLWYFYVCSTKTQIGTTGRHKIYEYAAFSFIFMKNDTIEDTANNECALSYT